MTRILRIVITPAITLRAHNLSTMKLQSIRLKVNEMRTLSRMCLNSTAAKGYDCAFCDKSTKIGTLVV